MAATLICIFVLLPILNGVFADETAAKAGDVDPNATPSGEGNAKIAVFAGAMAGVFYAFNYGKKSVKKTKKSRKAEPTKEELLNKLHELVATNNME